MCNETFSICEYSEPSLIWHLSNLKNLSYLNILYSPLISSTFLFL